MNTDPWLRNIHPQSLCSRAKTKIKFVLITEKCPTIFGKRKAYIIYAQTMYERTEKLENETQENTAI
jgi:hypothetical protein